MGGFPCRAGPGAHGPSRTGPGAHVSSSAGPGAHGSDVLLKLAPRASIGTWTELHESCERGDVSAVQRRSHVGVDAGDENGWTSLLEAAEKGHVGVVNLLLQAGANPNLADKNGWTPMMAVAECGKPQIALSLLSAKGSIDWQDNKGWTCTMEAAEKGNSPMVKIFVSNADPKTLNVTCKKGWTALMAACEGGNLDCVKELWMHGAEHGVETPHYHGGSWTALDEAKRKGFKSIVAFMEPIVEAESNLKKMLETDGWEPEEAMVYLDRAQQVWCLKGLVEKASDRLQDSLKLRILDPNSPTREDCFDWFVNPLMENNNMAAGDCSEELQDAMVDICRGRLAKATEGDSIAAVKWAMASAAKSNSSKFLPNEMEAAVAKYRVLMEVPAGWDVNSMAEHLDGSGRMIHKHFIDDATAVQQLEEFALRTLCRKYTRDRKGEKVPDSIKIVKVLSVKNDQVFQEYSLKCKKLPAPGPQDANLPTFLTSATCDVLPHLDTHINETWLWHGTSEAAAEAITTDDFCLNLAGSNAGTLYGSGIYFADSVSKSDEYCVANREGVRCLLLCRVALGRILYTDAVHPNPGELTNRCLSGEYNSVLGDRERCRGTFKEFIVFDDDQAYPEYVIYYKRVY